MKKWQVILSSVVLCVVLIGAVFYSGFRFAVHYYDLSDLQATRFALSTVRNQFLRPVEDSMIAKGVLSATQDPYSVFFTKEEYESFETQLSDMYVGIGIMLQGTEKGFFITRVFPDSPAAYAEMKAGMQILQVDQQSVEGKDLEWVASKVRGLENTAVSLTILSPQESQQKEYSLIRKKVKLQTVDSAMLENQIGYIAIHSFSHGTSVDFSAQLDQLLLSEPKGIILDLRDNGGGLLDETIRIAERILPSNSVLFYTKGRDSLMEEKRIGDSKPLSLPLYVIVNQNSASASEVLSGAIQDMKVGKIVGEKTFGKASIQKIFPNVLTGEAIKLTVQTYLTPLKQDLMEKGITPDILFENLEWTDTIATDPVITFLSSKMK